MFCNYGFLWGKWILIWYILYRLLNYLVLIWFRHWLCIRLGNVLLFIAWDLNLVDNPLLELGSEIVVESWSHVFIEVILNLLPDHRNVLHKHQLTLERQSSLKFTIIAQLLIEVPKEVHMVVIRVKYLFHLEGWQHQDLAGRDHMEILGFSVRKKLHHQNSLLKSGLNVDLSLFLSSSHFNTEIALVKLGKSVIWMKKDIIKWVLFASFKLINSDINVSNLLVTIFHVFRKLLLERDLISCSLMHKYPIDNRSCREPFKSLFVNLLSEFPLKQVLQIPPIG